MRRIDYEHAGAEHGVELKDAGDQLVSATVHAGGSWKTLTFSATDLGGGRYLVRVGDAVHDVRVERDARGPGVRVRLGQEVVVLEKLDPFRDSVRKGRAGGGSRKVQSPMPGRVVDVLVAAGDTVTAGQPLVIVEAMKMANELRSPMDGRVKSVSAVKGAPVDAGALLVVIEG